jgi:hypothetical protein
MEIATLFLSFAAGMGIGTTAGYWLKGREAPIDVSGTIESLQREKEIAFREATSLRQEIDKLLREREEIIKKYEEELIKRNRQLQVQLSENKRLGDRLSMLQLEKKNLENRLTALESKLRASIPREMVRSLVEAEKMLSKIREFIRTGEVKNYRLIASDEHEKVFARMFAEEEKIFLTSPFITEDAVVKRLPEIESFLDRGGTLFLTIGREWNTVRFGDEGLLILMKTVSQKGNAKVFADNIHHKILAGEKTAVITSYNFLSKNNRSREAGVEIDDEDLARSIINLEIENLRTSPTVRKVFYKAFRVEKVERSTSGKTYRVETDADDMPRIYFPLEIEPAEGSSYETVIMQQLEGNFAQVVAARKK